MNKNKIYAGLDDQAGTPAVIDAAAWCARHLQASLEFLCVLERDSDPRMTVADLRGVVGRDAQETLLRQLSELDQQQVLSVQQTVRLLLMNARYRALASGIDDVGIRLDHRVLEQHASDIEGDARLLVLGSHFPRADADGRRHTRYLREALYRMKSPVLMVPDQAFLAPRRIVLAFDHRLLSHRHLIVLLLQTPELAQLPVFVTLARTHDVKSRQRFGEMNELLACAGFDVRTCLGGETSEDMASSLSASKGPALLIMGNDNDSCWRHLVRDRTAGPSPDSSETSVLVVACN